MGKLRLAFLMLPLFLMACGSITQSPYSRLSKEVNELPEPEYYHTEVNRTVEQSAEPETSNKLMEDVEKLFQIKEEQQANTLKTLYDFNSPQSLEYQKIATSEDMNAKLGESVNLDLLLNVAYERNQELKAAYGKIDAAIEQYPQAAYLDNILSQYNAFTKQLDTKIGPLQHKEMTAMKFPFPDMMAIKGNIITQDVQIMQKDAEIVLRDLITDLRLAYFNYLFINESLDITRENQELLKQMLQIATIKFQAGLESYQSVLKAQVELSMLSDSIFTLEEKRETIVARINTLLDRKPDAAIGPPELLEHVNIDLPLNELYKLGIEHRQEIQKQKIAINKMELMIQMANKMSTPDASLGNSYYEDRMALRTGTQKMPPTFMTERTLNSQSAEWFAKDDAYAREIEVKVDAMQKMITNMEDKTRFMIKLHHFGADTAKRTVALYNNTLLPQAQQTLEAANTAYQAAKIDFLNLLDAQRMLLKFRLARQKAILEHREHIAQLEQAVAYPLPKEVLDLNHFTQNKEE